MPFELSPVMEVTPSMAEDDARPLHDSHGRAITDLRLSVTDRCNYRCVYCRNGEDGTGISEIPMAEYARILRLFVALGIRKIRFTGGEPLLRKGLTGLIRETVAMGREAGVELDLALTTNGHLLAPMAQELRDAGLSRITVSMDAVDAATFERITRVPGGFERVLEGIRAAGRAGLGPVKVNAVLMRGFNEDQIEAFARFSRDEGVIVRFIEWMPLEEATPEGMAGASNRWSADTVVPLDEITARLANVGPLVALPANHLSETARRYTFADGVGEIGIIAPVSNPFCGQCSRVRVTSDGKLRTCLFSQFDHDLYRRMLRGEDDAALTRWIRSVVDQKEARHHIGEPGFLKPSRSMVHIGG